MKANLWRAAAAMVAVCVSAASGQELYKPSAGPFKVQQRDADWRDEARKLDVPVRVYVPREAAGKETGTGETPVPRQEAKRPLIVFSHGLGGSRKGYGYICEHLASHGYVVVVPTHAGSDTEAVQKEMRERVRERVRGGPKPKEGPIAESTSNPENLRNRPRDISFVIDYVGQDAALSRLVDLDRVGVAGHSFGAYTAMAEAGMLVDVPEGKDQSLRDARVKAVLPMSPQGRGAMGVDAGAWGKIEVPVLFLTGTKDYGQGERSAAWRREAFDAIGTVDEYLVVLDGAEHKTFGGRGGKGHEHHEELIKAVTTAWFDAQLRGDEKAALWLKAFGMGKRGDCTVEYKPAPQVDKK